MYNKLNMHIFFRHQWTPGHQSCQHLCHPDWTGEPPAQGEGPQKGHGAAKEGHKGREKSSSKFSNKLKTQNLELCCLL